MAPAQLPEARGPLSEYVIERLRCNEFRSGAAPRPTDDPLWSDDLNLALYTCYELHYESFAGVDSQWEWSPGLLSFRRTLERSFEAALADLVPTRAGVGGAAFLDALLEIIAQDKAPSWVIPRLRGPGKAALVEIQSDEYGSGRPDRVHAALFAKTMAALDLDPSYGGYLDRLPGVTLATVNLMSMFGLHRKWRGAAIGHLVAFEVTSPDPNRRYGNGLRRLGLGGNATDFFDEHVEADSIHETIAIHDLAGALVAHEPELGSDVLFGVDCLLAVEGRWSSHVLERWERGESSLGTTSADAFST